MSAKRVVSALIASLLVTGCASLPTVGGLSGGGEDYAAGSSLGMRLSGRDRAALSGAFVNAMEAGAESSWRGRKASGVVEPGGFALANLRPNPADQIDLAHGDINLSYVMETELGAHVMTRNSNVRSGAGTDSRILEVIPSGTGVEVVGRVVRAPWMLVAQDGVVRGYVHQNLITKAPGTELELAGGPQRRPLLCRKFSQRLRLDGVADQWRGSACHDGAAWRLAVRARELRGPDF